LVPCYIIFSNLKVAGFKSNQAIKHIKFVENFSDLNLNESLKHSIARMHFKIPTPIQAQAIPPALLGKDILGTAQTGTGKTLCYGIACINKLLNDRGSNALIYVQRVS